MRIDIKPEGGARYKRALAGLDGGQIAQATAEAINMGAGRVKNSMRSEMQNVFDRPTGYVLQSVQVVKKATAGDLNALVAPTYMGGKGVDPQQILAAQEDGGRRRDKRSEKALRTAGILPIGYQTAIPATPYRSEEHTSELQSRLHLVCRLLLEKNISVSALLVCRRPAASSPWARTAKRRHHTYST